MATSSPTPPTAEAPAESRRDRLRRELVDQVCDAALDQLRTGGPGSVTWRGLARAVDMSPAGLYTYFSGLDELFTTLILRSYAALAAGVEAGVAAVGDRPPGDRLLAGPLAYRRWAVDHPAEFNLVFTDQFPGYAAEPDGPTVAAQLQVFRPMAVTVAEAEGRDPGDDPLEPRPRDPSVLVGLWATFHGFVSLEVNHHLDWVGDTAPLYEDRVRAVIASLGLPPAAADVAELVGP